MSCKFLVLEFETKEVHRIVGVSAENGFSYATFGRNRQFHMVPSNFAQEMWIDAMVNFLENRIVFEMPNMPDADTLPIELTSNIDVVGLPDEIIGNFFMLAHIFSECFLPH